MAGLLLLNELVWLDIEESSIRVLVHLDANAVILTRRLSNLIARCDCIAHEIRFFVEPNQWELLEEDRANRETE